MNINKNTILKNALVLTLLLIVHFHRTEPLMGTSGLESCIQCLDGGGGCTRYCDCYCPDPAFPNGAWYGCQLGGGHGYRCYNQQHTSWAMGLCPASECEEECAPIGQYCVNQSDCCSETCEDNTCCLDNSSSCTLDDDCCSGICNQIIGQCSDNPSPILINLKNGTANYRLTSASAGVAFDLDTDGIRERIAWTAPDSSIAFLAMDRNDNGAIDDGSELFGNYTLKRDGTRARHGFDALLDLDGGPAISDRKIDSNDAVFTELRLWIDRNQNGISEPPELLALADGGVVALYTDFRETRRVDRHGNQYRYAGTALISKNGREHIRRVFDVFFAVLH